MNKTSSYSTLWSSQGISKDLQSNLKRAPKTQTSHFGSCVLPIRIDGIRPTNTPSTLQLCVSSLFIYISHYCFSYCQVLSVASSTEGARASCFSPGASFLRPLSHITVPSCVVSCLASVRPSGSMFSLVDNQGSTQPQAGTVLAIFSQTNP